MLFVSFSARSIDTSTLDLASGASSSRAQSKLVPYRRTRRSMILNTGGTNFCIGEAPLLFWIGAQRVTFPIEDYFSIAFSVASSAYIVSLIITLPFFTRAEQYTANCNSLVKATSRRRKYTEN